MECGVTLNLYIDMHAYLVHTGLFHLVMRIIARTCKAWSFNTRVVGVLMEVILYLFVFACIHILQSVDYDHFGLEVG